MIEQQLMVIVSMIISCMATRVDTPRVTLLGRFSAACSTAAHCGVLLSVMYRLEVLEGHGCRGVYVNMFVCLGCCAFLSTWGCTVLVLSSYPGSSLHWHSLSKGDTQLHRGASFCPYPVLCGHRSWFLQVGICYLSQFPVRGGVHSHNWVVNSCCVTDLRGHKQSRLLGRLCMCWHLINTSGKPPRDAAKIVLTTIHRVSVRVLRIQVRLVHCFVWVPSKTSKGFHVFDSALLLFNAE